MISQIIYEVRKDQFASAGKVLMDIGLAGLYDFFALFSVFLMHECACYPRA